MIGLVSTLAIICGIGFFATSFWCYALNKEVDKLNNIIKKYKEKYSDEIDTH